MSANANDVPRSPTERGPWVEPKLSRLPASEAGFGGGAIPDLEGLPS